MRSVWIAVCLVIGLLAMAALLRPRSDKSLLAEPGISSQAAEVKGDLEVGASEELEGGGVAKRLAATDLAQIMVLRAELGGAADYASVGASSADFERELQRLAGLEGKSPPGEGSISRQMDSGSQDERLTRRREIIRQAAADLEELAKDAARAGDNSQADELRWSAEQIRHLSR